MSVGEGQVDVAVTQIQTVLVCCLQKYVRTFVARRRFLKLRRGVIRLQAIIRGSLVRNRFRQIKLSIIRIQKHYRRHRSTRQERQDLINFRKAARVIQHEWRRWKFRQGIE